MIELAEVLLYRVDPLPLLKEPPVRMMTQMVLSLMLALLVQLNAIADSRAESIEDRMLQDLIAGSYEIPQGKEAMVAFLAEEFQQASQPHLRELLFSTSATIHRSLVRALVQFDDVENIAQLMEEMENHRESYLRFFIAVSRELKKDPDRYKRILEGVENLYASYAITPIRLPSTGGRLLQATLLTLGG